MMIVDNDVKVGISVIASFSGTGKIIPIYFRAFENGEEMPIQVSVHNTQEQAFRTLFDCTYVQGNIKREIQLVYLHREHLWQLWNK